jgi:hypothetical protein
VIPYLLGLAAAFDHTGQVAALGGFASKMGLASGPLLAGWLLGDGDDYTKLIAAGIAGLLLCAAAGVFPALRQDRTPRVAQA